jgi:thioredoxin reductase (NADPH)
MSVLTTDVAVIGAGPVGLFQVFQLGLQGLQAHVVDALPYPGGQCAALYGDKPIYDIPALPLCTGQELTDRLLQQIAPFAAPLHLGQEVQTLDLLPEDGGFALTTHTGTTLQAKAVIVAGGVGSFQPRRLKLEGLAAFEDQQVFHHAADLSPWAGQRVLIVGDGEAALQAAVGLAELGSQVVLLHRRDVFSAAPATVAQMRALCAAQQMRFVVGQVSGIQSHVQRLTHALVTTPSGATHPIALDTLLVLQGLSPKLGPIAQWGLGMSHKQVAVDTEKFQTSTPGIFAVGDINTYPGKRKLIVSGFHEATLAAFAAAAHIHPGHTQPLLYTTSSSLLQQRLGVAAR